MKHLPTIPSPTRFVKQLKASDSWILATLMLLKWTVVSLLRMFKTACSILTLKNAVQWRIPQSYRDFSTDHLPLGYIVPKKGCRWLNIFSLPLPPYPQIVLRAKQIKLIQKNKVFNNMHRGKNTSDFRLLFGAQIHLCSLLWLVCITAK